MKLVIFDIDGTLTKTNGVDGTCYIAAVRRYIHADFETFDADTFTHYTDSSIVLELYERYQGRLPSTAEVAAFKTYYLALLQAAYEADPDSFLPVSGANAILRNLPTGWRVALATGCWSESAEMKLRFAGIESAAGLPKGTACDARSRAAIITSAITKSTQAYGDSHYDKVVYVGDGLWDLRTCAQMGLPFIGIEAEGDLRKRAQLGAAWRLTDYEQIADFGALLAVI